MNDEGDTVANTHIALLRGINVGRAKRVAMADLRKLVESLGFGDVRTLLNSGNVVYSASRTTPSAAAARIEKALTRELGVTSRITVLSAAELGDVVRENPLLDVADDPSRLLVAALNRPADRSKLETLAKQDWGKEVLALGTRVAYLWCHEGILASKLVIAVNRVLGDGVTARNWATVLKLQAMAASVADSER